MNLRMPFTRNHYYGTGSAKHSSFSYMTRALRALVCNCMTSCFAKPSSVIMISCKRYSVVSLPRLYLFLLCLQLCNCGYTSSICNWYDGCRAFCLVCPTVCINHFFDGRLYSCQFWKIVPLSFQILLQQRYINAMLHLQ